MKRRSTATTEERYINDCKNQAMLELYMKIKLVVFECFENAGTGATSDYVHWNISGSRRTRQFANFYIQKSKIRILTLPPIINNDVGAMVPDKHQWTLNYQTDISTDEDILKVKEILIESYNQIKQLI